MNIIKDYFRDLQQQSALGWNRFWFTPADPATLGLIRLLAGAMLLYTHAVWLLDLEAFFGAQSWINRSVAEATQAGGYQWSHLWLCRSPGALWGAHLLALGVFTLLMVGLYTRPVSILAYLITVSYANRVPAALFGLDQINALLALYLMLGPSGAAFSLDLWVLRRQARRAGKELPGPVPSVSANVAIRLIQLHLCVLYLFAGLSKLQGAAWWDGTAIWSAVANLEYQSIDMTWLVRWPLMVNLLTHVSVAWEISYCALVWPRLTRPIVIFLALPLHLGIAICLGMSTFGLAMLIANMAFVSPGLVRCLIGADQAPRTKSVERLPLKKPAYFLRKKVDAAARSLESQRP